MSGAKYKTIPIAGSDIPYVSDQNRLALYYSASNVFLYPSLADNCPLVVLESLACGTPVVTFKTGGIPELMAHKEDGYIAEYKNAKDLANGLELYLNNDMSLDKRMLLFYKIRDNYSLTRMVQEYHRVYDSL